MPYFVLSLLSVVGFAWLGRRMAIGRNRNSFLWGLAGALFPPLLLILKFLGHLPGDEKSNPDTLHAN